MNNLLIATVLLLSSVVTNDTYRVSLLKSEFFEVTLGSEDIMKKFISADYDEKTKKLTFVTRDNIHSILVYNGEEQDEFVLPVMADHVTIGKSMFDPGKYKLGFNFQDQLEVIYAEMNMK